MKSKRFQALAERPVNKDGFVAEWPEVGLIAIGSPNDPRPSIKIASGKIVEMDGKQREEFDLIDRFIADYGIDLDIAGKAMAIESVEIARMLVDINVSREKVLKVTKGLTPAKIVDVIEKMNILEIMMAMQKMRARKRPGNQCHVTNVRDNPVLIAADAAEGALRGFDEQETTVGITRYAPFNALALLIGAQTGRGGVLTQCALEESFELTLGMRGLTTYAETISVYGTEQVFVDGDDTPWSKAFLASAYASRGLKMRFTSGTGSEVQMGYAEGKSMLYLEAKCILIAKAAGVQGLQNGSISCIGVPGAVPTGIRVVAGENLITMMLDLEVASGNDQTFSHSDIRRTARLMPQLLAGTDLILSGYSAVPNYDNMFAGSNFDIEDVDDYLVLQRDLMVEGGLRPVTEEETITVRNKAAKILQAVFKKLGLPTVTDEEVEAATLAHGSRDMPARDVNEDIKAATEMMQKRITGLDVARVIAESGYTDVAVNILNMLKQRIAGDYLHTSAVLDKSFNIDSAVNNPNDYAGPGTGYRLSPERWKEIKEIFQALKPESFNTREGA